MTNEKYRKDRSNCQIDILQLIVRKKNARTKIARTNARSTDQKKNIYQNEMPERMPDRNARSTVHKIKITIHVQTIPLEQDCTSQQLISNTNCHAKFCIRLAKEDKGGFILLEVTVNLNIFLKIKLVGQLDVTMKLTFNDSHQQLTVNRISERFLKWDHNRNNTSPDFNEEMEPRRRVVSRMQMHAKSAHRFIPNLPL
jgi:hypothetical protein